MESRQKHGYGSRNRAGGVASGSFYAGGIRVLPSWAMVHRDARVEKAIWQGAVRRRAHRGVAGIYGGRRGYRVQGGRRDLAGLIRRCRNFSSEVRASTRQTSIPINLCAPRTAKENI